VEARLIIRYEEQLPYLERETRLRRLRELAMEQGTVTN